MTVEPMIVLPIRRSLIPGDTGCPEFVRNVDIGNIKELGSNLSPEELAWLEYAFYYVIVVRLKGIQFRGSCYYTNFLV